MSDEKIPGFKVEHLCELPANLALTELGVRPCVAFLYPSNTSPTSASPPTKSDAEEPSVEEKLIPRLDRGEVAAVFTAPFYAFLRKEWTGDDPLAMQKNGKPEKWYTGRWTDWNNSQWRMHNFYIPRPLPFAFRLRNPPQSSAPSAPSSFPPQRLPEGDDPKPDPTALDDITAFRVFGMTARILVDAARVAYGEEPEFEHNSDFGDEEMMRRLLKMGRLSKDKVEGEVLTKEVLREASKI